MSTERHTMRRTSSTTGKQRPTAKKIKAGPKATAKTAGKAAVRIATKPATSTGKTRRRPTKGLPTDTVYEIFRRFQGLEAEPKGELEHSNPYTLLVAVVLSAQATDKGVNIATRPLFALADSPEKMLALGEDKVRDLIKTIGLFRNKAKNVIALSKKLLADHGGVVPENRDLLETLPGVGRKTANVVMSMAFGHTTMAVDTHVFRVAHRLGFSKGKDPLAVEDDLMRTIPDEFAFHAHHWLILHGRYLCKSRKPECWRCHIADLCPLKDKTPPPK